MRTILISFGLVLSACATMGGATGKSSSAPFQGKDAVEKRRKEIVEASKAANDCLKNPDGVKGGFFAVVADANGKLSAQQVKWDGPAPVAQCILDAASKATVTPLPGPPVGNLWSFWMPGAEPPVQQPPSDLEGKLASMQALAQAEIASCGERFLGVDFYAEVQVASFVTADGKAYAPTLLKSTAKDGSFDGCVLDVIAKAKFPQLDIVNPVPIPLNFHIGVSGGFK
jgi:hypothetical protein